MELDPGTLSRGEAYRLLIALVVPRPIAWVSTLDRQGRPNLAPFSFFGGVTSDPLTVMVSVGRRRGEPKDTTRNLRATSEAVIHVPHRPLAEAMVKTSADLAHGEDEFAFAGLTKIRARHVRPWRIDGAAVALESRVVRHLEVGNGPVDCFLLEVVHVHVDDALVVDGLPDAARMAAVGRLGGSLYCTTEKPFALERPG